MSIIFENTDVWGFEGAVRGMRNALESWGLSDSGYFGSSVGHKNYILGEKDLNLCQRLIKAGDPSHRKFMRQIMVSVDITAPLYWWKECDTYKVGTVANSCSTMHTIHKKEFTLEDFSIEHLIFDRNVPNEEYEEVDDLNDRTGWDIVNEKYCGMDDSTFIDYNVFSGDLFECYMQMMNRARELYLKTKDKKYWYIMIEMLPSSYNQKRTITLNYENLRSIYFQRRNHKLDEWREGFCSWVKTLPYAKELIIFDPNNGIKIETGDKMLAPGLMPAT